MARRHIVCAVVAALCVAVLLQAGGAVAAKKKESAPDRFMLGDTIWRIHKSEEGRGFFVNTATGKSQWEDPRVEEMTGKEKFLTFLLFLSPFLLIAVAGGGYIFHVYRTKPDLFKEKKKVKGKRIGGKVLVGDKLVEAEDKARKKALAGGSESDTSVKKSN